MRAAWWWRAWAKRLLEGRRLQEAMDQNRKAAERLDAAVKEMLEQ